MYDQPEGCPHRPSDSQHRDPKGGRRWSSSGARSSWRGRHHYPDERSVRFPRAGPFRHPYERRSVFIVPDIGVPCQLDPVRFTPVRGWRASRVTGSTPSSCNFVQFVPEVGFPVGSYKSSAFGGAPASAVAALAAPLVHPFREFVDNSVDEGPRRRLRSIPSRVRKGVVPCGGTTIKIVSHCAGAPGVIVPSRPLSTGWPVQGRRVDDESRVLGAPGGGVRFGVYTCPMTSQAASRCSALALSAALVGAVGR